MPISPALILAAIVLIYLFMSINILNASNSLSAIKVSPFLSDRTCYTYEIAAYPHMLTIASIS